MSDDESLEQLGEKGICLVCGGTAQFSLKFESTPLFETELTSHKYTRVDLCATHYKSLRQIMWDHLHSNDRT